MTSEQYRQVKRAVIDAIKANAHQSRQLRLEKNALTWKSGTAAEVQRLRSTQFVEGKRVVGKRAFKQFRQTESSRERCSIWVNRVAVGRETRFLMLILGMLKNRIYTQVERTQHYPSIWRLSELLDHFMPNHGIPASVFEAWISGGPSPLARQTIQKTVDTSAQRERLGWRPLDAAEQDALRESNLDHIMAEIHQSQV